MTRLESLLNDNTMFPASRGRKSHAAPAMAAAAVLAGCGGSDGGGANTSTPANNVIAAESGDITVPGTEGNDTIHAGDGQQTLRGLEGDDILHAGPNSDTLDGGTGDDTAVFEGSRTDYRIWRTNADTDNEEVIVLHKSNDGDAADHGRNVLTGIEALRFGEGSATALDGITFDNPTVGVADGAPATRAESVQAEEAVEIDVADWFDSDADGVTYAVEASSGTATVEGSVVIFTAGSGAGTATLTVTASDDDGDYDDAAHAHEITVAAASTGPAVDGTIWVFQGSRSDHRIWKENGDDGGEAIFALRKVTGAEPVQAPNGIQTLRFGDGPGTVLPAFEFDDPTLDVDDDAPEERAESIETGDVIEIDVSDWFNGGDSSNTVHTVEATGGTATVEGSVVTFTAGSEAGTATLTVTASDEAGDHDDASHTYDVAVTQRTTNIPELLEDLLDLENEAKVDEVLFRTGGEIPEISLFAASHRAILMGVPDVEFDVTYSMGNPGPTFDEDTGILSGTPTASEDFTTTLTATSGEHTETRTVEFTRGEPISSSRLENELFDGDDVDVAIDLGDAFKSPNGRDVEFNVSVTRYSLVEFQGEEFSPGKFRIERFYNLERGSIEDFDEIALADGQITLSDSDGENGDGNERDILKYDFFVGAEESGLGGDEAFQRISLTEKDAFSFFRRVNVKDTENNTVSFSLEDIIFTENENLDTSDVDISLVRGPGFDESSPAEGWEFVANDFIVRGATENVVNGSYPYISIDSNPRHVRFDVYSHNELSRSEANDDTPFTRPSKLIGTAGDDRVEGSRYGDILEGGDGDDTFLYLPVSRGDFPGDHPEHDIINDFVVGEDTLEFSTERFPGQSAPVQTQEGDNRFITFDGVDDFSITLLGVNTPLTAIDYSFV